MTVFNISFIKNGIGQANLCKAETADQARAYFESIAPDAEIIGVSVNNEGYKPGKPCHEVPDGWIATDTAENIINSLKFTFEIANDQKNLLTPAHVLYKCRITTPAHRRFTFDYQCNPNASHTPTKEDCLYCLLSDASSYECARDVDDFLTEFGYTDSLQNIRKGEKAFKACGRIAAAIDRLFTEEEREALNGYFENY